MSKVLIPIDLQKDFIDGALGTKEAKAIVDNVITEIKRCKAEGYKIFATRDTHFKKGQKHPAYEDTLEGKKLPVPHCIINTEGWQIYPSIAEALGDNVIIVNKLTFGSEELIGWLKAEDALDPITEIVIIGLCTDICVASNTLMLRAAFKDVPIILKEKCCAGVTPETHNAAITTMKMCQIDVE